MTKSVEFQVIPKLQEGETLVVYIEVGDMPKDIATEFVANIEKDFMKGRTDSDTVHYIFSSKRSAVNLM